MQTTPTAAGASDAGFSSNSGDLSGSTMGSSGSIPTSSNSTEGSSGSTIALGDGMKSDAKQMGQTAVNRLHSEVDNRKGAAVGQVKSVSSALNNVAGQLDDGAPQWLKSAIQQGAQQVQRFADGIEQKDSRQILNDVQRLARDNPGTFLAACAGIGFAAARIFKAGPSDSFQGQSSQNQNQSSQTQYPPVQGEDPMRSSSTSSDFGQFQSAPVPGVSGDYR
jgi:hypothetical protein